MRRCKKCVQLNTRPGIYFNEEGICGACLYEEEKKNINWSQREQRLNEIVEWAKVTARKRNSNYDCIIGVSGGKDSTFQTLYVKDKLGLRALLVNCEPENITKLGKKNIENLKKLGFDSMVMRPNPVVIKKLIKKDFYEHCNPIKVTEFALYASVSIIAEKFNIPLIIQGDNQAFTLGVRMIELKANDDALGVNKLDTLSTGWDRYISDNITEEDLFFYHYDEQKLRKKGIRAIYLQYYTKEWTSPANGRFAIAHGLAIRPDYFNPHEIGTYARYYSLDSDLNQVNQMLKYIKFGFGQCTDHACYDIREGTITREEGLELVKKYDGKCDIQYIKKFCDYIGITIEEFWRVADSFRGPMWERDANGEWILKEEK